MQLGLETQKETISLLLATYEAHMLQQQTTVNSARKLDSTLHRTNLGARQSVDVPTADGGEWTQPASEDASQYQLA